MAAIKVNFDTIIGRIKPVHGVGQPPIYGLSEDHFAYLTKAAIPYSRLHDVGGIYGGGRFVDIPNIFRDFSADVYDPDSYDFAFTDWLIATLYKYECKPVFRLGVTIENFCHIKAYRIHPPTDYKKWAKICEHIIRHYNEGWANGFTYGIQYWEIWNEPEFSPFPERNQMWTGSMEDYFRLYDVTSKHLKACFGDSIKVGGYASCGFAGIWLDPEKYGLAIEKRENMPHNVEYALEFFYKFFDYIRKNGCPIDFFSWHSYMETRDVEIMADFMYRELTSFGYGDLEIHLNEWNNVVGNEHKGTSRASANACSMLCAMQKKHVDVGCYYDAELGSGNYAGLFNPLTYEPFCTYYAFFAFGELYRLKNQVECTYEQNGLYVIAAADGEKRAVLAVNISDADMELATGLSENMRVELVDAEHLLSVSDLDAAAFTLKQNQIALITNYR